MKLFVLLLLLVVASAQQINYLQRSLSTGEIINIYYKCYGKLNTASRQVWFLSGPKTISDAMDFHLYVLSTSDPNGYYCTTDFRGTGYSDELKCTDETQYDCSVTPKCKEELSEKYNLTDFSITKAAEDVIELITLNKRFMAADSEVIIYGLSFGTFWVQRIMQLNDIANKYVLDSVVPQPWMHHGAWQYGAIHADTLMMQFLTNCTLNEICQQHFSGDALNDFVAMMRHASDDVRTYISYSIANVFDNPGENSNGFVGAINLINLMVTPTSKAKRDQPCAINPIVYKLVVANELYCDMAVNETLFDFLHAYNKLTFDIGTSALMDMVMWIDEMTINYSPITIKGTVLILSGEMDIRAASNANQLNAYFIANNVKSTILTGTNWGSGVIGFITNDHTNDDIWCGLSIIQQFILDHIMSTNCLQHSIMATFESAYYTGYPTPSVPNSTTTPNEPSESSMNIFLKCIIIIIPILLIMSMVIYFYCKSRKTRVSLTDDIVLNEHEYNRMVDSS
jgi:hypothetical protein